MRRSRFSESMVVEVLREGDAGIPVPEILRRHEISRHTYFSWKRKYAGATVEELMRLRELEAENAKLKRICTGLALENAAIREVLARKP